MPPCEAIHSRTIDLEGLVSLHADHVAHVAVAHEAGDAWDDIFVVGHPPGVRHQSVENGGERNIADARRPKVDHVDVRLGAGGAIPAA